VGAEEVSIFAAFVAGLLSFLSPCVLPLIPSYIAFITGVTFDDLKGKQDDEVENRKEVIRLTAINSLFFIIGFSIIFIFLGAVSTVIGNFLKNNARIIEIIGGTIITFLGLHILGVFKVKKLYQEKRVHLEKKPRGPIGSSLVGMTFAAGWTPCIGPILGSILVLASQSGTVFSGMGLLAVYSLGLAIPFFLSAVLFTSFLTLSSKVKKHFRTIEIVSGVLIILVGVLFISGFFSSVTRSLS
jgi:cytochrome c-type biogenesis protein